MNVKKICAIAAVCLVLLVVLLVKKPSRAASEELKAAREHPEEYKTLSVRVSGWNARFVTLNEEWQDMVIERTEKGI